MIIEDASSSSVGLSLIATSSSSTLLPVALSQASTIVLLGLVLQYET